jgi:hypothetical protein
MEFGYNDNLDKLREVLDKYALNKYGFRNDTTLKGGGWLGELNLPSGDIATEYSIGLDLGKGEVEIPSLVPTLNKFEVEDMRNNIIPQNKKVPESVLKKAVDFYRQQVKNKEKIFF